MNSFNFRKAAQELDERREEGLTFEDKQLSWNNAADVNDVVEALKNTKVVHYLKLEGNTLGVEAAEAIGNALQRHREFRKALWRNMFTGRLKTEIPRALELLGGGLMRAGAQLTVLDLSDNALGPNGMVGLEALLRSPTCYTLQELHLNNCGLGIGGGQMLSRALLDCHAASTSAGTPLRLRVFVTGRNRLENKGTEAIAELFSVLQTLEEIAMPQNFIYHQGIHALAESFKRNPSLRVLNLNDNTVTPTGALHLAKAFNITQNLRSINFGDCLLKTDGAYYFSEALAQRHTYLETIDLSSNEIEVDGGVAIVNAMLNKTHLKELNLDDNPFGYDGCQRIREAMGICPNPDALGPLDDANSDDEEDDEDDDEENFDGADEEDVDNEEEYLEEEEDDDDDDETEEYAEEEEAGQNDTTEEADEDFEDESYDDDEGDEGEEETLYTTSCDFYKADSDSETASLVTALHLSPSRLAHCTIEEFIFQPHPCSLPQFAGLSHANKFNSFQKLLKQTFRQDEYLMWSMHSALKVAHLSTLSVGALELAVQLLKECFDSATKMKEERRIVNFVLMHLGLLRTEEDFEPLYCPVNCAYALRETLYQHSKTLSKYVNEVCTVFLNNAK